MKSPFNITKGPASFRALCRRKDTTPITKNGTVVAFVVPRARMERLLEQMEILSNPAAMRAIRRAKAGKGSDHPLSALNEN
jgi:hypothetical protein